MVPDREGFVDGEEVECPFHQGRFHIPTGHPSAPPCTAIGGLGGSDDDRLFG
jgi:nitrite reductase/ring-hydroxylating ferredoxin subunit